MKLLLDTGVFLRLAFEPDRLPEFVREGVDGAETVFLSVASVWEMAIKSSLGKLSLPMAAGEYATDRAQRLGADVLPIAAQHAAAVEHLPFYHRDPFDRLLVAQAAFEGLTLVTTDRMLVRYDVAVLSEAKARRRR